MPIKFENLDDGKGVVLVGEGIVTGEDIIHVNKRILSFQEKIKNSKYCIIDYSYITDYNVSKSEIQFIAFQDKVISQYIPDYLVAIIAKEDLEYGFSRMWEIIVETEGLQWETKVFKDRDGAYQWIKHKAKEKYNIDVIMA